jgi:pimeloyl-ACP methyl ester carboxylesterase
LELVRLSSGAALHVGGAGPPLLFLHGVGGGAWSWTPQVDRFSRDYRVFVWEARGHGDASPVQDAGLAEYYEDARQALAFAIEHAGCPVTLVAHSMGGLLAIALAASQPADVAGLFLVDPVYSDGSDAAYGHVSPAFGPVVRWMCTPVIDSFARNGRLSRVLARLVFERAFTNRDRMESAWLSQRLQIPFEYRKMLRDSFVRPDGFAFRDFSSEITAPVFLLDTARPDGGTRFPELVRTLDRRLGTRFTHGAVAGGHYLQLDRFEDVNGFLERFLEGLATN